MASPAQPEAERMAPQSGAGPSRADALASRRRILEAASALVGDRRVTMSELAAAAGVGRSTLYRHFPTREALDEALEALESGRGKPAWRDTPVGWRVATMPFLAPGRLGRDRPLALEVTRVLDEVPAHDYEPTERQLHHGERLTLLTDGITGRKMENGETFGVDGLRQALEQADNPTAASTAMAIQQAVTDRWREPLQDDGTVVVMAVE
jgi:AcrR family transcriptional regulator